MYYVTKIVQRPNNRGVTLLEFHYDRRDEVPFDSVSTVSFFKKGIDKMTNIYIGSDYRARMRYLSESDRRIARGIVYGRAE